MNPLNVELLENAESLDLDGIKRLQEQGADIQLKDEFDDSLLHIVSSQDGAEECIRYLVEQGVPINGQGEVEQQTPLIVACQAGVHENVAVLLSLGADVALLDHQGDDALAFAILSQSLPCCELLVEAGADVHAPRGEGDSLLSYALNTWEVNTDIISLLFEKEIDINGEFGNGTALMTAISFENHAMVEMLLAHGARWDVPHAGTNEDSLTFAKRVGNEEILALFQAYLG